MSRRLLVPLILATAAAALPCADAAAFEPLATWGSTGSGPGQLNQPYDLAVEPNTGKQYVADHDNYRVVQFDANGNFVRSWGSLGSADTQFAGPEGIDVDPQGNVWVADSDNSRVKKFDANGSLVAVFGVTGAGPGQYMTPTDVAVDAGGNYYVSEQAPSGRVQKFDPAGGFITQWAVSNPTGVTVLGSKIVASNYNSNTIEVFDLNGTPLTGALGGTGTAAGQFTTPWHVAASPDGSLFISERDNGRVTKMSGAPVFINAFGWDVISAASAFQICTSTCQQGSSGMGLGQFASPSGVDVDCRGNVYVADQGQNRVQKFGEPNAAALPCVIPYAPSKDSIAPVISSVRISPGKFRVNRSVSTTRRKRAPKGTKISYALSEAATVTFAAERKTIGRKVGKRCRAKTRSNRKRRKCTLYKQVGKTFAQSGKAGPNTKAFSGKIGSKVLKPGSYRLVVTAKDIAGNSSKRSQKSVKIVR